MKKNVMRINMTGLLLALLLPLQVYAEGSGDGFRLDQSGAVTLDSPHAAREGISSCCFSLTVEPENGNHVEFVFAGELAEIMEYRYNADEKKLNVYMAGTASLFPEGTESLAIGKVVVTDGSGKSGKATVSVDEGSLQFVYGSESRTMEDVDMPEAVTLGQSGGSGTINPPNPVVTPPPADTSSPTTPPAPSDSTGSATGGNQSNGTPSPGGQDGSGQNGSVPVRRPGGTQVGSTQGTGGGQGTGNQGNGGQGTGSSQEGSSAQESESEVENSAQPSQESPSESVESSEEEMASAGTESREEEENLSKGEGGFWKELKPVLTGLGIGALLLGIGAAVVMVLIKAPKRK